MTTPEDPFGLLDFAANFIRSRRITHYSEIRTEELVEYFRQFFDVPLFPRLADLHRLCTRLGIDVDNLPRSSEGPDALNGWYEGSNPRIRLKRTLTKRYEHSLGHEIREILENALKKVSPSYVGLDTNDNSLMNPESDQFAASLLMPLVESRSLMQALGYDFIAFARETERSLSSVVVRAQTLFSAKSRVGPVSGAWLFECPWDIVEAGGAGCGDLKVTCLAQMNGFTRAKNKGQAAQLARVIFPHRGAVGTSQELVVKAVVSGTTTGCLMAGFDIFAEQDFLIGVEPLFIRGIPWQVLMTAVRMDCVEIARPWAERLELWPLVEVARPVT